MNLKITLQTLRRIEQLLDGWQSSGDIPAIERDLACDLLRRAYDDIFFSDKSAATAPEAPLAENASADHTNEEAVSEAADTPVDAAAVADEALIADVVSPVGLVGLAPSETVEETVEEMPEESPENAESVEEPAAEDAPIEVPAEAPAEEEAFVDTPAEEEAFVETPVEEPAPVDTPVEDPASVETLVDEHASVEESVEDPASAETPVEENTPVETPVDEPAEEEIPVEEFGETGEFGDAVEESGDAVSEDVATSIPETPADIVIDPVFEVFTDEDEAAEEPNGAEEPEDTDASEPVDLVGAVNVVEAVEAAEDMEIAEDMEVVEVVEDMEMVEEIAAEETEIERPVAAPAAMQPASERPVAATVAPAAESGQKPTLTVASAETSTEETRADAAASNTETLEEMAARFKNASGRRRKSRRAFMSLYDDDETSRRGASNDQLELSDWGVEPADTSAKLRHTRELFGLPADDPDTTPEPTPQPAAEADADAADDEMEVIDFVSDDNLVQSDLTAKPAAESPFRPATELTSEPTATQTVTQTVTPTEPTPRPTAAPAREERDDAEDDLSLDSIEIVEIADSDEDTPVIEEDETQYADRTEVSDEQASPEVADSAAFATESAAAQGLYDREEDPELPVSTPVLGEVMGHDVPTVGDTLGHRPDVAGWTEVSDDLNHAISVGDRFVLLRDLFDGDQALCDRTLKRLSTFDDLDDCMIWITENFAWNANSEGAKLIMGLLERKLG